MSAPLLDVVTHVDAMIEGQVEDNEVEDGLLGVVTHTGDGTNYA